MHTIPQAAARPTAARCQHLLLLLLLLVLLPCC
jgi:hypothetical protein